MPLVAELGEVIQHCHSITSIRVASPEITRHSNGVAERFRTRIDDLDSDELLEHLDLDALAGIELVQIDGVDLLVALWLLDGDWEASETIIVVDISLVLVVDPIDEITIGRSCDFEDVVSDADGGVLDVAPESDELGSEMDVESETVGELRIGCHDEIALSVELVVFVLPGADCGWGRCVEEMK